MNKFEKELLDYIDEICRKEIDQNIVKIKVSTDEISSNIVAQEIDSGEFVIESANTCKGWMVEIRRKREKLKDVRIVIESPDLDIMNETDDYRLILRTMAERAKDILNNPPFEQYISQGVIRAALEGEYVEFIPRDRLERVQ